jgi:hypothetical protein
MVAQIGLGAAIVKDDSLGPNVSRETLEWRRSKMFHVKHWWLDVSHHILRQAQDERS